MKASYYKNAATLALFAAPWPHCFSVYERRRSPLKLGIRHDIMSVLDGAIMLPEPRRRR
jgi:sRNA-binding protein